jgi:hypothetical protein
LTYAKNAQNKIQTAILAFFCILLSGCEPEATPFPVDVPALATEAIVETTQAQAPIQEAPQSGVQPAAIVRYAIATFALPARDIEQLQTAANVTFLDEAPNISDLGGNYDIIAAYGELPGANISPVMSHVSLVIHAQVPPMNDPAVVHVIRRALSPVADSISGLQPEVMETAPARTLRAELANAGWPDGFDLKLDDAGFPIMLGEQFGMLGIGVRPTQSNDVHITVVTWTTPEDRAVFVQQAGDETLVIDLFAVPISYWAVEGLNITFTPSGWPIHSP